jgi:hypothetical protein
MTHWTAPGGAALICLAAATPAMAELTATQVWEQWRQLYESAGQTVTAETSRDGRTLRVENFRSEMDVEGGSVTSTIDFMEFTERGDGTVEITMAPVYAVEAEVQGPDGETADVTVTIEQSGFAMIASGDESGQTYDFELSAMSAVLESVVVDGEDEDFSGVVEATGLQGTYAIQPGDAPVLSGSVTGDALNIGLSGTDPEDGEVEMNFTFTALEGSFDGTLVEVMGDNMAAAVDQGLALESALSHGPAVYQISVTGDESFAFNAEMTGGGTTTRLDAEGLAYGVEARNLTATMSGSEIPFPELSVSMAGLDMGFDMPVQASDTPDDFAANVALEGLAVDDMLWSMLDPQGMLPHDPATLIVALSGQANWFYDIMDPSAEKALEEGVPGALHALSLDALEVDLVGARLTGGGAFSFDNDDLETFDGMPAPSGTANFELEGGNALLDTLVAMGLLPEDQAMGARMMLGLFARPGDGEDTLVSTIEVKDDGAVLANGQRIR